MKESLQDVANSWLRLAKQAEMESAREGGWPNDDPAAQG